MRVLRNCVWTFVFVVGAYALCIPRPVFAASVTADIPDAYQTVKPGDRVYFDVTFVTPENVGLHDFKISYTVQEGTEILVSSKFIKAVETQASFIDYFTVPNTAKPGLHTLNVTIIDDTGKAVARDVSVSFQVESKLDWAALYFYILIGTILAVGGFIVFEIRHTMFEIVRNRR